MHRLMFLTSLFALACASSSEDGDFDLGSFSISDDGNDDANDDANDDGNDDGVDDGADDDAPPTGDPIQATVRIIDVMTNGGMADVAVENAFGDSDTTNSSGLATVPVYSNGNFEISLQKSGAIDHLLFGPAGDADFSYITFMATEMLVNSVLAMLGANPEDGTGVVVVGIDYDDLSPAVGARAALNVAHDDPWVLRGMGPEYGDTIPEGAMGMVAFSNVQPGSVAIDVSPPDGADCTAYPGGGDMPEAPVEANQVTVVTFHCR